MIFEVCTLANFEEFTDGLMLFEGRFFGLFFGGVFSPCLTNFKARMELLWRIDVVLWRQRREFVLYWQFLYAEKELSESREKILSMNAEIEDLKKKIGLEEQEHHELLQKHEEMVSQLQQEKVNTDYKSV